MEKQKHPAAHNLASATCKNRHHRMGQQQQPKALWVVFAKNKNNGTRITTIEISEQ